MDVYRHVLVCLFTHFNSCVNHTRISKTSYNYERREYSSTRAQQMWSARPLLRPCKFLLLILTSEAEDLYKSYYSRFLKLQTFSSKRTLKSFFAKLHTLAMFATHTKNQNCLIFFIFFPILLFMREHVSSGYVPCDHLTPIKMQLQKHRWQSITLHLE